MKDCPSFPRKRDDQRDLVVNVIVRTFGKCAKAVRPLYKDGVVCRLFRAVVDPNFHFVRVFVYCRGFENAGALTF